MTTPLTVICCQLNCVWENKAASIARVENLLKASPPPADALLVLPEMFSTGFSMDAGTIAEGDEREADLALQRIARLYRIFVTGGVVTLGEDGKGRNQSVTYSPDGAEIARYSKIYPFTLGGESDAYTAGSEPVVFDCAGFQTSPFICYDLRFPEIFRKSVSLGAELYIVIASWPQRRIGHWTALLQARAIENQAYVIGVNRCGADPTLAYNGRSMVIEPGGAILADAGNGECLVSAEIDLETLRAYRKQLPFLADMR